METRRRLQHGIRSGVGGGSVQKGAEVMRALRLFFVGPAAKALVALAVTLAWLVVVIQPAGADTITFTGQGTNADGTCGSFEGQPPPPGGTQTWQFNLTNSAAGATMSATFSDGTTVTNKAADNHTPGGVSMWFITTAAGAKVTSASATFTPSGTNPQFVVSHCTAGGTPPPTTS
ncbi:MAG TPA: hypothetical protein VFA62_01880, partial [Acidimicrobiia bacterium]|nr:hypothetical protein [Acidimicrobiia bacterium]